MFHVFITIVGFKCNDMGFSFGFVRGFQRWWQCFILLLILVKCKMPWVDEYFPLLLFCIFILEYMLCCIMSYTLIIFQRMRDDLKWYKSSYIGLVSAVEEHLLFDGFFTTFLVMIELSDVQFLWFSCLPWRHSNRCVEEALLFCIIRRCIIIVTCCKGNV